MSSRGALLLAAVITIFFADVLFLGNNFWFRDLLAYHFPMKHVVRETIMRGEFPWWNGYFGGGQPMAANPAYEIFYPPQWLIFIGSFQFGFALHIVFHVYLAVLGMYAFLRSIPLRIEAAMFGALSFGLSGFLLGTVTNLPTFFVWSWAGVVGWAVLRLIRGRSIAPAAIALAFPIILMEPMAIAQLLFLTVVGTAYADRRALPRLFAAIGVAVAIAAIQILPSIDHARDSARARGFRYDVVTDYSMPPIRPVELIAPRAFGLLDPTAHAFWGYRYFGSRGTPYLLSLYCGAAVCILAIAGFVTRQRGAGIVALICGLSYLLAIGSHTPLFRILYGGGVRFIRYPEKFAAMALVALIVFAAFVADRLLAGDAVARRAALVIAVVAGALLVLAAAWWGAGAPAGAQRTLVLAAIIAAAWAVVLWRMGTSRVWNLLALALLVFDLGSFSNEALLRMPRRFFTAPGIVRALDPGFDRYAIFHRGEWTQKDIARQYDAVSPAWFTRNALRPYSAASWGVRSVLEADFDETDLLPTHDLLDAMMRLGNSGYPRWSEPFMIMSNVRYVADFRDFAAVMAEARGDPSIWNPLRVQRVRDQGRYWFARRVVPIAEFDAFVRANEVSGVAFLFKPFVPAEGRILSTGDKWLDVESAGNALLMITVTRHKYWQATIDGRYAPLLPANIAYQALVVPPGRHRIELRYRNPLVWWGAGVSAVGLLLLVAFSLGRRWPEGPDEGR